MKRLAAIITAAAILTPASAEAFCGFYVAPQDGPLYNDATMVALMREGTRTALSMSNNYKGPAADFAMVVPVPVVLQKENVKTLDKGIFTRLEALTAPRLVEYWEQDPCQQNYMYDSPKGGAVKSSAAPAPAAKKPDADYGVKIEAKFTVGEYDILVLSAKQSDGLETWLHDNKYKIPKGASAALAPYVKEQWKFFVAKIDVKKVQMDAQGVAILSPLRFHYESQDFRLPVRLGLLNSRGQQDLLVWVLSQTSRYDVANYSNVFIPTNLEVTDETKKSFGAFYAALFDEAIKKAGGRAVVTEYSWATSSCDPCPTPPLGPNEIASLGGDVLLGMGVPPPPPPMPGPSPKGPMPPPPPPMKKPGWGGPFGGFTPMVVTRLHTRYDPTTLGDDLVFRAAAGVVGGREHVVGQNGELEKGAQLSTANNFQGRYIIRHKWAGAIKCANPQRNIWGGPPGSYGVPPPAPATNLASAPRGTVKLASLLKAGMPAFEVTAAVGVPATIAPPDVDAGVDATTTPPDDASLEPLPAADGSPATVPSVEPKPGGCGCNVPGGSSGAGAVLALAVAMTALLRRSRKVKP
jgi:MYXO-CTERM domain-containing protein